MWGSSSTDNLLLLASILQTIESRFIISCHGNTVTTFLGTVSLNMTVPKVPFGTYAVVLKLLEGNLRVLFFSPSNNRPFNFNFSVPSFYFPHLFIFQIDVKFGDRKTNCQNICSKKKRFCKSNELFSHIHASHHFKYPETHKIHTPIQSLECRNTSTE